MYEQPNRKTIEREQAEKPIDALFRLTQEISLEINADAKRRYGVTESLVNDRGVLSMDFFSRNHGGIYTFEEIHNDKEAILAKEIEWSGAGDPNVQDFYKKTKHIEGKEAIAHDRMKEKERDKSSQMEMLTNTIFYKILKERFIVVRSSTYDDYFSGIDNYLVDKQTGDIVCAFDEVHDHKQGNRKEKKWERVEAIEKGGKQIKYGVVPQDDKLVQKGIKNIPVFFLSLTTEELIRGMEGFSRDLSKGPNELELNYFNKYIALLDEEYDRVKDMNMPGPTRENLNKFKRALETMRGFTKSPNTIE